jgi:uncharacterized membrane protein
VNVRPLLAIGGAVVAAMLVTSAVAWAALPPDAVIPIHWNLAGEVDGTAPKAVGLLLTPAIAGGLALLLAAAPFLDPRREHLRSSMGAYTVIGAAVLAFVGGVHLVVVWAALGNPIEIARVMGIGVVLLFAAIGAVIGRSESNWSMGVRTPWTLSSERSWKRTHRLAGRLFLVAAVIVLLATLLGGPVLIFGAVVGAVVVVVAAVVAYSYVAWRDDPDREGSRA